MEDAGNLGGNAGNMGGNEGLIEFGLIEFVLLNSV